MALQRLLQNGRSGKASVIATGFLQLGQSRWAVFTGMLLAHKLKVV